MLSFQIIKQSLRFLRGTCGVRKMSSLNTDWHFFHVRLIFSANKKITIMTYSENN